MPTFKYEAMDAQGNEWKDVIEAPNEEEAQATIRAMGYFVTRLTVQKLKASKDGGRKKKKKTFSIGGVSTRILTVFTRQLSILQDAGLPILRSLRILESQCKPGPLKNALMDVCDDIESGNNLSESMSKQPKAFDRLYVNMIKAGEAGGALELILQRLADFLEKAESLKRKVKGAMVYPVVVVMVAVGIMTFIMIKIIPAFQKIFDDFGATLPAMTQTLMWMSYMVVNWWFMIPAIPISIWLLVKISGQFRYGREGWDLFKLKMPVFGMIIEKNIVAKTTRTLGTLVASGVPILESLNITRETSGNTMFESMYLQIYESIREGESIAPPMRRGARPKFNAVALWWWSFFILGPIGALLYLAKSNKRIVDDLVVNMVDVGEETGELDTMLYKIADVHDEEVTVLTDSLTSLLEPIMIVILGGMVGYIVIALFLPLVKIIETLT